MSKKQNKPAPIPKWTKYDFWEMKASLAKVILSAIIHFRNSGPCGYPARLDSMEEWEQILNQIEDGFFAFVKCGAYPLFAPEGAHVQERFDTGMKLFVEYFEDLWD